MLASNFKECFFRLFKPLDNLLGNFFNLLTGVFTANCTFPDKAYTPALFLIVFKVFCIPFFVVRKLIFPEVLIRFWKNKVRTVFMGVPEAAVYEDYNIIARKNKVRLSRIPFVTDAIPKTGFIKGRANLFFRFCIL